MLFKTAALFLQPHLTSDVARTYSELDATVSSLTAAAKTEAAPRVSEHRSQDSESQRETALSGEVRRGASSPSTGPWGHRPGSREERQSPGGQAGGEGLENGQRPRGRRPGFGVHHFACEARRQRCSS